MKLTKDIFAAFLAAMLVMTHAAAQKAYFQEQVFSSPISHIRPVTGIGADDNNCIWLTTQAGIYRYDGKQFKLYSVSNTPALKSERFARIFDIHSRQGYSWGMQDNKGNLYAIDSLSRLRPFVAKPQDRQTIVYSTLNYPLINSDKSAGINEQLSHNLYETHTLPLHNRVFIVTLNGVVRTMSTTEFLNKQLGDSIFSLGKNCENRTFRTEDHFYLVSSSGLLTWTANTLTPRSVVLTGDIVGKHKRIRFDSLYSIITRSPGIIPLYYAGSLYESFVSSDGNVINTRLLFTDNGKSPPSHIYYSPENKIIICYYPDKGLVIFRPHRFSLLSWNDPKNERTDGEDYYYSIIPDRNGFITANNNGIIRLGLNGEKQLLIKKRCVKFFLHRDKAGNIWYESQEQGRMISYLQAGTGLEVKVMNADTIGLFSGLYQYDDSTYYILTNKYLYKVLFKDGQMASIRTLYTRRTSTEELYMLYPLNNDVLWVGSDQGITAFNITNNTTTRIEAVKNTYIRSVIKLEEGNYLVGTYDKGVYQYIDNVWIHLSFAGKDLPLSAHGFVIDRSGSWIWYSSNEGILRMPLNQLLRHSPPAGNNNIRTGHFRNFESKISPEFNGSSNTSAAQLSDSCIAFANVNGLVIFNPRQFTSPPLPGKILIETGTDTSDTEPFIANRKNTYSLSFSPVIPYFGDPGDLDISYQLTNADKEWHQLSVNPVISYNNIDAGYHELQFRIRDFSNTQGREISITSAAINVPFRWYQTTWFIISVTVTALLLIILLHNLRTWYLKKRKKELENLVKIKTGELQKTNKKLSDTVNELSKSEANLRQSNYLKDEYYAVLTHDLRSPLKFLSFNISQLLARMGEMDNDKLRRGLVAAYECSNDVYKLIDEFVYWIQDNEKQLEPRPFSTLINATLTDIKNIYGFSLEGNKNNLITDIPAELHFTTDPQMFFIILRNAIDNANKYTSGGVIIVSAARENGSLRVTVSDTGCGIGDDLREQLVQLQYDNVQFGHKKRRSLGFYIMAMLTKKLDGSYTINSVQGKGTDVNFLFPELKTPGAEAER